MGVRRAVRGKLFYYWALCRNAPTQSPASQRLWLTKESREAELSGPQRRRRRGPDAGTCSRCFVPCDLSIRVRRSPPRRLRWPPVHGGEKRHRAVHRVNRGRNVRCLRTINRWCVARMSALNPSRKNKARQKCQAPCDKKSVDGTHSPADPPLPGSCGTPSRNNGPATSGSPASGEGGLSLAGGGGSIEPSGRTPPPPLSGK